MLRSDLLAGRFAWGLLAFAALALEVFAGLLVDHLHRQAGLAAVVEAEQLDLDLVAFLDDVGGLLHARRGELADVDETVLGAEEVHESAELHHLDDGAVIDLADFRIGGDRLDPLDSGLHGLAVVVGDLHGTVVLDVDLGAGFLDDLTDHLAAGVDHFADLGGGDLEGLDARRVFAELGTGVGERLRHLAEDVDTSILGLAERDLHDLLGDALDLDVHLERGDALLGTGDLEVHVAEMVLVTEDVGENRETLVFEDQAHRDARGRPLQRHAGIHQRERSAADRSHRGRAVRLGDLRHHARGVGEFVVRRQHRVDRAPGQLAVTDLAALGAAEATGLTDRVGREVVVQQERLFVRSRQRVDILLVLAGAERGHDHRLGLAAGEQRRAVGAGQHADLGDNVAHGLAIAAVDALAGVEDVPANDFGFELLEHAADAQLVVFRLLPFWEIMGDHLFLDL